MYKTCNMLIILITIINISCQKNSLKVMQQSDTVEKSQISGWIDEDTYMVQAYGKTELKAVEMAKHQILKDIVNVRVLNQSPYTDITRIQNEFQNPLDEGKILSMKNTTSGFQVFFQIYSKGLKKKFERK